MSFEDDNLLALYNDRLVALSSQVSVPVRLSFFDATAHAFSPICGSEVDIDIAVRDDKIITFGYEVEACALTKAVVAVMRRALIGKGLSDIRRIARQMEDMLSGATPVFDADWQELSVLEPVRDYKARHNSIMLPFEAVEKAFMHLDEGKK